jgi:hypothetical protein
MFQPLKGLEHSKRYLKDKEYRQKYKAWEKQQTEKIIPILSKFQACTIETDSFYHIVSPSFYDKTYQITDFNKQMQPLGHRTYETIEQLIKDNAMILKGQIIEYITKEATA